jgi:hypothetical protein
MMPPTAPGPYQQQQGGFAPPPGSPVPNADPLRLPIMLIVGGLGVQCVGRLFLVFLMRVVIGSMHDTMSAIQTVSLLSAGLGLAGAALLLAGAVTLSQKKRPGHQLATASAIAIGIQCFLVVGTYALNFALRSVAFGRLTSVATSLAAAASVGLLLFSLRSLAQSRARSFDAIALGVGVVLGIDVLFALARLAGAYPPNIVSMLLALIDVGARVAMIVTLLRFANTASLADPTFAQDSAYRGPMGAMMPGQVAVEGNMALGFCAGFFGGCIGLGLVLALAKGQRTKRGAGIGFACQSMVGIAIRAAAH